MCLRDCKCFSEYLQEAVHIHHQRILLGNHWIEAKFAHLRMNLHHPYIRISKQNIFLNLCVCKGILLLFWVGGFR